MAWADPTLTSVELGEALVDAWGSWGPTLDPQCRTIAFLSDRSGSPRVGSRSCPHPV